MSKLKVIELFSGIGSQTQALENCGIEHEVVGVSEIDKYAIQVYNRLHGETRNLGDIMKLKSEDIPQADLVTYSFPCQDVSVAGKQKGLDANSGTRSSLLWNVATVIEAVKPKYLLMENVKNLVGTTHKANFLKWLDYLETKGYHTYWKVLNSKDFGIPQSRERVFAVSILGNETFDFPTGEKTSLTINDILQDNIDLKYFMNDKPLVFRDKIVRSDKGLIHVGDLNMKGNDSIRRVYSPSGLCPTLTTMTGGHRQPKIYLGDKGVRKLTPRECWLLMGFSNEAMDLVRNEFSDTQLYKQAGNTIVVNVLEAIFAELFKNKIKGGTA